MSVETGFVPQTVRSLRLYQEQATLSVIPEAAPLVIELAAAHALNVGDAVYLDANGCAAKSATVADYQTRIGIIVGGQRTDNRVRLAATDVGVVAASAINEKVLVCILGVCHAISGASLNPGVRVTVDTGTAGRITTTGAAAGNVLGYTISSQATPGSAIKLLVGVPI